MKQTYVRLNKYTTIEYMCQWKMKDNARSTTSYTYNLPERGVDMAIVTIEAPDGKIYTDPSKVKIRREDFPELYRILENFKPKSKDETA